MTIGHPHVAQGRLVPRNRALWSSGDDDRQPLEKLEQPMKRFPVDWDRIIMSCPTLQLGQSTRPRRGWSVPSRTYFFSFSDQERYPFRSTYWRISSKRSLVARFVTLNLCRDTVLTITHYIIKTRIKLLS